MGSIMRRILTLAVLFTAVVAGLGCQHIAGRCDCSHHADDAQNHAANNPYPVVSGGVTTAK